MKERKLKFDILSIFYDTPQTLDMVIYFIMHYINRVNVIISIKFKLLTKTTIQNTR